MSYLPHAKSFRDLVAYQKAKALAKEIFQIMTAKSEKFCSGSPYVIREETAEYFAKNKDDDTDD